MISAVILAAGMSTRMESNKLLLPIGEMSIIEHVVEKAKKSNIDEIIVVTGRDSERLTDLIKRFDVKSVYNPLYQSGQSTSVKMGLNHISSESDGVMFIMGDQPMINPEIINEMLTLFKTSDKSILVPMRNNKRGNPVLFSACWFASLRDVEGDKGGREIIKSNPDEIEFFEIIDPLFLEDVDDERMYKNLKNNLA